MSRRKSPRRERIGRVAIYEHHGAQWPRLPDGQRRRVGSRARSECLASLLSAKLVAEEAGLDLPALLTETLGSVLLTTAAAATDGPAVSGITPAQLREPFLQYHEHVAGSPPSTVSRYASATLHLVGFWSQDVLAVPVDAFVQHLRTVKVSPNGHANTAKRHLRDKGIQYIAETCRSMVRFGIRKGILPRNAANPFSDIASRLKIRDAKHVFVFSAEDELGFFRAANAWEFAVHVTLAKTGMRPGELAHLLVEDVDLSSGWLHIRNKPELGWSIKTGRERRVPIVSELAPVLKRVAGARKSGPLFLRAKFDIDRPSALRGDRAELARIAQDRVEQARGEQDTPLTRKHEQRIRETVWRDAGAVPVDRIRTSFIRACKAAGLNATCPKSWRHTFATLMQEANVDLIVRQEVMGHKPAAATSALGMTGVYTHSTPAFVSSEIRRAARLRPRSLELALSLFAPGRTP